MGRRCGFAIEELARRHGDFAIAGAAVAVQLDGDDRVSRCGVGLLGLGSTRGAHRRRTGGRGQRVDDITAADIGHLAVSGSTTSPPTCRARPATAPGSAPSWWRAPGRLPPQRQRSNPAMHELPVRLSVNGRSVEEAVEPRVTLADFLRETCG
ncbi:CO dehydrogenase flavoC-terminal domain protein [Mycobacterium xenopi 3993]|nr:CO dehydrogenase flavoC-terminal domain protein [Mycobacterium xenopi 3993]